MPTQDTFGHWLKRRRKALDLTQEELALRVGCSLVLIQKIEKGERRPSKQIAELLAEQLGIPLDERRAFSRFARIHNTSQFSEPPPWRTGYRAATNLPAQPMPLIGRERELETVERWLLEKRVRLLTLTGPAGIGKTRLGVQVALDLLDEFQDGSFLVNLAPIRDCDLVIPSIARVLGVRETPSKSLFERVRDHMADKQLLLLLDNLEQVVAAGPFIADLVAGCPWIKVLTTSRVPLHLRAERQFPVPPLALPQPGDPRKKEILARYSSVELFLDRALAVQPDFELTEEIAGIVAEICARLDGLPLAIELVAARISDVSLESILEQIAHRLALLVDGPYDLPERHRTLRDSIAWSYDLLTLPEQRLFEQMSVFSGGCTLEAVQAVCNIPTGPESPQDVHALLTSLADKNLITEEQTEQENRFSMLETIREYGQERLDEHGDAPLRRRRHADYYCRLVQEAEPELTGPRQGNRLDELDREQNNLSTMLEWAIAQAETEHALRACGALWRFWELRGYLTEGLSWIRAALSIPTHGSQSDVSTRWRAQALYGAGWLARDVGDFPLSKEFFQSCTMLEARIDSKELANVLYGLAGTEFLLGNYQESERLYDKCLSLYRLIDDKRGLAMLLLRAARQAIGQGDYKRAEQSLDESLALQKQRKEKYGMALVLGNMGELAIYQGDTTRARAHLEESSGLLNELGEKRMRSWVLVKLGEAAWHEGALTQAQALLEQSLDLAEESESKWNIAYALTYLGIVSLAQGETGRARALCLKSLSLFEELGDELDIAQTTKDVARAAIGEHDYAQARSLYRHCLRTFKRLNYKPDIVECLEGLSTINALTSCPHQAVPLLAVAHGLRARLGAPMPPVLRPAFERTLASLRNELGEEQFARLWDDAQNKSMASIIEEALLDTDH